MTDVPPQVFSHAYASKTLCFFGREEMYCFSCDSHNIQLLFIILPHLYFSGEYHFLNTIPAPKYKKFSFNEKN